MIELIVHMDCAGCEYKIKKALKKLKGVDDVEVDMNMQKVTVIGWADVDNILETIRKTGKKAEMWPYSPEAQHNSTVRQHYNINLDHYDHHNHIINHDDHHYYSGVSPSVMSYNYLTYSVQEDDVAAQSYDHRPYYYPRQPFSALVDDNAAVIFSDENPHACSVM